MAAYQAALQQSGVIMAETAAELFDIAFALASQPLPKGNRIAIVTNSGGPAALASDSLSANGFILGDLEQETKTNLRQHLVPSAQVNNPIDMLGGASPREYGQALEIVLADPGIDTALIVQVPTSLVDPVEVAIKIGSVAEKTQKTVMACLMGDASIQEARRTLHSLHIPMYIFPEQTGRVFGAMLRYGEWLSLPIELPAKLSGVDKNIAQMEINKCGKIKTLGEAYVRPILKAYGINVISGGNIATNKNEAVATAINVGFPVAMKIVSPDILHKSDAGGILLNLEDEKAVERGFEGIIEKINGFLPQAKIEGVLIEAMAPKGQEVIIGMRRDPQFGPLIMFGLGGVYVELFGDVAFRVAPFTRRDAVEMIHQTKAGRLLGGLRGQAPADIDAVVDCLLRLGQIALDFPEIDEIEINPLTVLPQGKGAIALDARAILK
jgi:acetyltransferase